jgi:two-component system cell cycle sensor histidine kinase/response regulator CckA
MNRRPPAGDAKTAAVTPDPLRDQLRDVVAFADTLIGVPDERTFFRQAVEFARQRLGLIRCAIWVRDGSRMRGTFGTSLRGETTDEYGFRHTMDAMWVRIFNTAATDPHWQLYPDAQLYEWDGTTTRPFARGWLAATPILKHEQRVAVLTNDAAGGPAACRSDQQQVVEIYCALLSHVLVRRDIERRMRDSEQLARATLDALAESVCVVDPQGDIVAVNEAWRAFNAGQPPQTCNEGANYLAVCRQAADGGDALARMFLEGFQDVQQGRREEFVLEYPCPSRTEMRWFSARVRRFGHPESAHFTVAHTDISSLKAAEATLAERVRYYESLVHNSLDIIAVLDQDGRFLFVNEAARGTLGYAPDELAGRSVADFLHPSDLVLANAEMARVLRGDLDENLLVFRLRASDGSWHDLEARGNALAAEPPRLLVTARDVSERVRSEHLRAAVRRISDAALTAPTLDDLYAALHRIVDDLMPARHFYIALYDAVADQLSFPYWRDGFDPVSPPKRPGHGLTELVLRRRQVTFIAPGDLEALQALGEAEVAGHPPVYWLGAPLRAGEDILGVVAVQTYDPQEVLGVRDRVALETLAGPIAAALVSKRHEAAHAASERSYQALFAEMPGAFVHLELVHDAQGQPVDARVLQANPAFETVTGMERDGLVGRLLSEVFTNHPRPWFAACRRVAASGQPERFEYQSDQLKRHFQFSVYCPHPGHCALIIEDVSAAHAARLEVQRRDAILEATAYAAERFLGSPDWESCVRDVLQALGRAADVSRVYVYEAVPDRDQRLLINQRYEWVAPGVRSMQGNPLVHHADLPALGLGRWQELLSQGLTIRGRVAGLPESEQPPLRAQDIESLILVPVFVQGRWWGFIGFDECRHERDWMPQEEGALRSAAQILAEAIQRKSSEEQTLVLRTALASAANGIVITDRSGRIVFVNEALCRLTGFTAREVLGQKPSILRSGAHDEQFYTDLWRTVLAGQVWRGEITNRRKDGTQYLEDMTITPVRDATGKLTHFIAIKQDITEQRNLQQQLLQAQKMESVGRLAGGIAHDFNNLLQAITGFSSILLGELGEGDPRRSDVEEIDRAAQRAVALTRQLLAFSRKQKMELAPINLSAVLQGTEKMLRRLIGEDIKLATETSPQLPLVRADAGQLEQIIVNLAVNARDAMPQGGQLTLAARAVTLEAHTLPAAAEARPGPFVRLDIRDTGSGMPPHVRERLFEPFFSTKGPGRGTGLGLAVVYGIVRQHEGFIDVDTAPGRGTAFSIYLPVSSDNAAVPAARPDTGADDPFLAGQGERVLVVEDEQGVRDFASRVLGGHGYRLQVAASLAEARQLFQAPGAAFDLLFTDVVLTDGNGLQLADELRARDPRLRVVLTSAYSEEQSRWPQIQRHGYYFISKPYAIVSLLRLLRDVLAAKQ